MPTRPPRLCGCGLVVASGVQCACQIKRNAERKARHDRDRPNANARGYSSKWREARNGFLAKHTKCVRCGAPATVVNHRVPHKGDKRLFWSRSNWEAVCAPCHNGPIQSAEKKPR
ncbi:HNH endonuclease signature motif containing protein [Fulvimarina sp. 2208YS6-2-32]|uniref:HNH endonuclease signature motif containing protein n=1 Tax=Fulvimarina uroteuthidis TaxID=3098149 RepID=A0ABU5I718_9HYPH|nr:HNH endonuclease signature motif containing protein [Fulvimarina sp. 2208YS6-2-32]MDY8111157.1 HNH endonuclease signature motif containing protein [Fulvimarina sp. 2208YS6-2-32]